jgi:diaminopimelate epimerase
VDIHFTKYHGTGNDFIIIDDRSEAFDMSDVQRIARMCDRHFGIGADGLILIREEQGYDFRMVYFNADGLEGSFCGNGARCAVAFAQTLGIVNSETRFIAYDGEHRGRIDNGRIAISMADVHGISEMESGFVTNTGSPHLVRFVPAPEDVDVLAEGRTIRYGIAFSTQGINVNFVSDRGNNTLRIRTYERGVEGETLSCGTGAVAAAAAFAYSGGHQGQRAYRLVSNGGDLEVRFKASGEDFTEVELKGEAVRVFSGVIAEP